MPRGKHKSPTAAFVLPEPLNTQLRERAEREGRTLSDLIRESLSEAEEQRQATDREGEEQRKLEKTVSG